MYDAIIVGGSFAGISAALHLARARQHILVVDSAEPRNRLARQAHGLFGHEGANPLALTQQAKTQLLGYPSVQWRQGRIMRASGSADAFSLLLQDGSEVEGRRIVLAHGVRDLLPDLPGFSECWGRSVLHCPYCHGFEMSQRHWGVMALPGSASHVIPLYRQWTDRLTYFANGEPVDAETQAMLDELSVSRVPDRVTAIEHDQGNIRALVTTAGRVEVEALFSGCKVELSSDLAAQLGCEMSEGALGPHIVTDSSGRTTIAGVFAAGDIAGPMHSISLAIGGGSMVGAWAHQSLVFGA